MMRLALLALLVIGCGAGVVTPVAGGACTSGGGPQCVAASDGGQSQSALFCEGGKWVEFGCDFSGCLSDGSSNSYCYLGPLQVGASCPGSYLRSSFRADCRLGNDQSTIYSCAAPGVMVAEQCQHGCTVPAADGFERCH